MRWVESWVGTSKLRPLSDDPEHWLHIVDGQGLPRFWGGVFPGPPSIFAYAFDNVSVCAKHVNSLLHKGLAASIEVIS
jgi:hypothetical protein